MNKTISKLISLQVGKVTTSGDKNSSDTLTKQYTTGSYKNPVEEKQKVTKLGIIGDEVADTKHHGGIDKAVFANSFLNYPKWIRFLGAESLPFGALAENLTLDSIDESDVCIGDIHKIGSVTLEVSQPRQPCWKISRRWNNKDFMKYIYDSGETGWYYRVLSEGEIEKGDMVELVKKADDPISIAQANSVMRDPSSDTELTQRLLDSEVLAQAWKNGLQKKIK